MNPVESILYFLFIFAVCMALLSLVAAFPKLKRLYGKWYVERDDRQMKALEAQVGKEAAERIDFLTGVLASTITAAVITAFMIWWES